MRKYLLFSIGCAAALGLTACEKPAEDAATAEPAEKTTMEQLKEEGVKLEAAVAEKAEEAMLAVEEKGAEMTQAAAEMAESASEKAGEVTSEMIAQAEEWIAQAEEYIAQGKDDLAASIVAELEAIKPSLPESLQRQVDKLEAMLGGGTAAPEAAAGQAAPSE